MTGARRIDLHAGRDARGSRSISATLDTDGQLVVDGQDLGPQVEAFGEGFREYAWTWSECGASTSQTWRRRCGSRP
jgi:hypothetical protein